jgi:hypothetical protein
VEAVDRRQPGGHRPRARRRVRRLRNQRLRVPEQNFTKIGSACFVSDSLLLKNESHWAVE